MASAKWRIRKFGGVWWLFPPGSLEPHYVAPSFEEALKHFAHMWVR